MNKKTITTIYIAIMLSMVMISSSILADENKTYTDPEGDVYVLDEESYESIEDFSDLKTTDTHPELDIKRIEYTKEDGSKEATIEFEVYGDIEDKGLDEDAIASGEMPLEYTVISYGLTINTSEQIYTITYSNEQCQLSKGGDAGLGSVDPLLSGFGAGNTINITDYVKDGGKLTINFDLDDEEETIVEISVITQYMSLDLTNIDFESETGDYGLEYYIDMYPNMLEVEIDGPSKAKVANKASFTASVSEGNAPYEYEWDFDEDGETDSTSASADYTYSETGNYTVTLTVTDSEGNVGEQYLPVQVLSANAVIDGEDGGGGMLVFFAIVILVIIIGIAAVFYVLKR